MEIQTKKSHYNISDRAFLTFARWIKVEQNIKNNIKNKKEETKQNIKQEQNESERINIYKALALLSKSAFSKAEEKKEKTTEQSKIQKILKSVSYFTIGAGIGYLLSYSWINEVYLGIYLGSSLLFGAAAVAVDYLKLEKFKKGFVKGSFIGGMLAGAITEFGISSVTLSAFVWGLIVGTIYQIKKD